MTRQSLRDDWVSEAQDDLDSLIRVDPALAQAALDGVDDLVNRRKIGKELGSRRNTGDLSGLRRLKFDLPGIHPYHAGHPDFHGVDGFVRGELMAKVSAHGYHDVTGRDLWKGKKWVNDTLVPISLFLLQADIPADKSLTSTEFRPVHAI